MVERQCAGGAGNSGGRGSARRRWQFWAALQVRLASAGGPGCFGGDAINAATNGALGGVGACRSRWWV